MKVAFLTLVGINNIEDRGIYSDLLREFRDRGHDVYIICPFERRENRKTELLEDKGAHILGVRTLNVQKINIIEKGLGTVLLEYQYKNAIRKYLKDIKFDLIMFSTPPITLVGAVRYLKRLSTNSVTYLLLKDIFPQNAVDINMMKKDSLLYKYFRSKEINLYNIADYIGCMSPANVKFLLENNKWLDPVKVEVCPNSVQPTALPFKNEKKTEINSYDSQRKALLTQYGIPTDKPIFIYGGNLGKPQGIEFLIRCMDTNVGRKDCHFVIVGNGTEYSKIEAWYNAHLGGSVTLLQRLPKEDYDLLLEYCQVGLIFLDHRFLIPNFPSRLLSYLEYAMPVICATDPNCDMGSVVEQNGFGFFCESNDVTAFTLCVNKMINSDIKVMGRKGYDFFLSNYTVENSYNIIMNHFKHFFGITNLVGTQS